MGGESRRRGAISHLIDGCTDALERTPAPAIDGAPLSSPRAHHRAAMLKFMANRFRRKNRYTRHKLIAAVYLVVGLLLANSHHYFAHVNGVKSFVSAVLAILLWPLLLLGISLHIK
jgi:hypothetical protein